MATNPFPMSCLTEIFDIMDAYVKESYQKNQDFRKALKKWRSKYSTSIEAAKNQNEKTSVDWIWELLTFLEQQTREGFCIKRKGDESEVAFHRSQISDLAKPAFREKFTKTVEEIVMEDNRKNRALACYIESTIDDFFEAKESLVQLDKIKHLLAVFQEGFRYCDVNGHSENDQIFQKARQFVLDLLQKELTASQSALKILHFLNYEEKEAQSKLSKIQPVSINNFGGFVNQFNSIFNSEKKQALLEEIRNLLPQQTFIFPDAHSDQYGQQLDCQEIVLNEILFEFKGEEIKIATMGITLLHELCHFKKDKFQRNNCETPEIIRKIQDKMETGDMVEFALFDRVVDLRVLCEDLELCKKLVNVSNLSDDEIEEVKKQYKKKEEEKKAQNTENTGKKIKRNQTKIVTCHYRRYHSKMHHRKPISPFSG